MTRRFLVPVLALLLAVACGGERKAATTPGGRPSEVRFPVAYDIQTLDFPRATDTTTRQLHALICDSLLRLDPHLRLVPRLAREGHFLNPEFPWNRA